MTQQFFDLTPSQRSKRYFVIIRSGHVDLIYALPEDGDPRERWDYFHYTFREHAHRSGDKRHAGEQNHLRKSVREGLSRSSHDSDSLLQSYTRDCKKLDKKFAFKTRQSLANALQACYDKYLPRARAQGKRLVFAWVGSDESAPVAPLRPPWAKEANVPKAIDNLGYELVEINGYKTATRCSICYGPLKPCWGTKKDRNNFRAECCDPETYEIIDGLRLCDSDFCRLTLPNDQPYRIMNLDKIILGNAMAIVQSLKRPQYLRYSTIES